MGLRQADPQALLQPDHHQRSVVVAFAVGGIEALGLLVGRFHLKGTFWDAVIRLNENFGTLGYFIVGLFFFSWVASVAFYKWRRFDELELGT